MKEKTARKINAALGRSLDARGCTQKRREDAADAYQLRLNIDRTGSAWIPKARRDEHFGATVVVSVKIPYGIDPRVVR